MDMLERYYKDSNFIINYYEKINSSNYQILLSEIYDYMKIISEYYYDDLIKEQYKFLRGDLLSIENKVSSAKLTDFNVTIDSNSNSFLEKLVYDTRKYLLILHGYFNNEDIFNDLNLANDCKKASSFIKNYCNKNKIKSYVISIYPGYDNNANLYDGNGYHFANIIKFNGRYYLVDLTYSQFFYGVRNNLNRLGVMGTGGCDAGIFMMMTEKGKRIANTIIKDGYIEIDEEIFKKYLDAFTISFRNGLYYENTNDFTYTTNYTMDDYVKFLLGKDSQINYEFSEYLGFQLKPLENMKLSFKRR